MTFLIRTDPRNIQPGQKVLRRVTGHGIIRTDELICAENEHGVIVNPRGYRLGHDGAEWYVYRSGNPALTEAIDVLAKALAEFDHEPDNEAAPAPPRKSHTTTRAEPRKPKPTRGETRIAYIQSLIRKGFTLDEVLADLRISRNGLYAFLHYHHRTDIWARLRGKVN